MNSGFVIGSGPKSTHSGEWPWPFIPAQEAAADRIAEITGLGRASLYHRFPGGKEEMADAVLSASSEVFGSYVLAPLRERGGLRGRLQRMAERLGEFYGDGGSSFVRVAVVQPDERIRLVAERLGFERGAAAC